MELILCQNYDFSIWFLILNFSLIFSLIFNLIFNLILWFWNDFWFGVKDIDCRPPLSVTEGQRKWFDLEAHRAGSELEDKTRRSLWTWVVALATGKNASSWSVDVQTLQELSDTGHLHVDSGLQLWLGSWIREIIMILAESSSQRYIAARFCVWLLANLICACVCACVYW